MTNSELRCEECGEAFVLTDEQKASYADAGYTLPTRCEACEDKRRAARAAEKAARRPPRRKRR